MRKPPTAAPGARSLTSGNRGATPTHDGVESAIRLRGTGGSPRLAGEAWHGRLARAVIHPDPAGPFAPPA